MLLIVVDYVRMAWLLFIAAAAAVYMFIQMEAMGFLDIC